MFRTETFLWKNEAKVVLVLDVCWSAFYWPNFGETRKEQKQFQQIFEFVWNSQFVWAELILNLSIWLDKKDREEQFNWFNKNFFCLSQVTLFLIVSSFLFKLWSFACFSFLFKCLTSKILSFLFSGTPRRWRLASAQGSHKFRFCQSWTICIVFGIS